jgi:hypothetical protein
MTSRTPPCDVVEEAEASASTISDERALQPCDVDLEAGGVPGMQEKTTGNEPAAEEEVYTIFTSGEITFIAIMASISTFYSPLTANIYFPALNTISTELGVSNTLVNLTVTTYMVIWSLLTVQSSAC